MKWAAQMRRKAKAKYGANIAIIRAAQDTGIQTVRGFIHHRKQTSLNDHRRTLCFLCGGLRLWNGEIELFVKASVHRSCSGLLRNIRVKATFTLLAETAARHQSI